jgi:ADP-ribose pyrophosphatase YjhB (NUDIX family)
MCIEGRMTPSEPPRFLRWAREIQALAQTGYEFAKDDYQKDRCRRLMEIAAEMVSENSNLEFIPVATAFKKQLGYATPKVDVRSAIFDRGRLLLVREVEDGGWTMPGGWADVGEVPSEAAEREVWEEAGFRVKARKVIGVYDANRVVPIQLFHAFKVVFLCDLLGGEARPSRETTEVGFFSRDEIPPKLSGERTRARHIEDAFAALQDPSVPTVFD